jgi:acyl dehydratase
MASSKECDMRVFQTLQEVADLVGQELAVSDWIEITQERINLFAQATGDHQWIHVDPQRANQGPFGSTIAHGFLTLSLMPSFFDSAMRVQDTRMAVNYGVNKVRFTSPVPVGSKLRARISLKSADPIDPQGFQMTYAVVVEREGADKPVCVAETIARRYA